MVSRKIHLLPNRNQMNSAIQDALPILCGWQTVEDIGLPAMNKEDDRVMIVVQCHDNDVSEILMVMA